METNLEKRLSTYAMQHGYVLTKQASSVIKGLETMKKKFGEYYCPCRIQRTPETICPCKFAPSDIKKTGHCHCNLFTRGE